MKQTITGTEELLYFMEYTQNEEELAKIICSIKNTKICEMCNTHKTPYWRNGPWISKKRRLLCCNSCGLKWAKQQKCIQNNNKIHV